MISSNSFSLYISSYVVLFTCSCAKIKMLTLAILLKPFVELTLFTYKSHHEFCSTYDVLPFRLLQITAISSAVNIYCSTMLHYLAKLTEAFNSNVSRWSISVSRSHCCGCQLFILYGFCEILNKFGFFVCFTYCFAWSMCSLCSPLGCGTNLGISLMWSHRVVGDSPFYSWNYLQKLHRLYMGQATNLVI